MMRTPPTESPGVPLKMMNKTHYLGTRRVMIRQDLASQKILLKSSQVVKLDAYMDGVAGI